MSFGSIAYASYVRIRSESDHRTFPDWTDLSHQRRIAWEAAAQAVALSAIPALSNEDSFDDEGSLKCDAHVTVVPAQAV